MYTFSWLISWLLIWYGAHLVGVATGNPKLVEPIMIVALGVLIFIGATGERIMQEIKKGEKKE